ncbi:cytochrome P450 [Dactylosporangium darangshiense]|uniref:cytochrome P450 n=1 Tax=Dactylosporangium darangshiense TaxID=579108 RepID=UPI00363FCA9B
MTVIAGRPLGLFHLQLPEVIADPVGFYAELLDAGPVVDPLTGAWLVARHHDVQLLLTHPASSVRMDHAGALARFPGAGLRTAFDALDLHVSFADPPEHGRLRRALAEPVQVRHVRTGLAAAIDQAVTTTFDDLPPARPGTHAGRVDVVAAIAARVPIAVTAHLLGMDDVDLATVRRWSLAWGDVVAAPGHVPTTGRAEVLQAVDELVTYLRDLVTRHEQQPGGTMVDHLVSLIHTGVLSRDEVIANLMMITTAGSETTTNLISAVIMSLADDADLWSLVRREPNLIGEMIEELGRLHPPTQYTARRMTERVVLASGAVIPAGATVVLMLAAANRDPVAFPAPHEIRLDRTGVRPLTYGHGPHHCFGAPLAQFEAHRTVLELATRYRLLAPLPGRPGGTTPTSAASPACRSS